MACCLRTYPTSHAYAWASRLFLHSDNTERSVYSGSENRQPMAWLLLPFLWLYNWGEVTSIYLSRRSNASERWDQGGRRCRQDSVGSEVVRRALLRFGHHKFCAASPSLASSLWAGERTLNLYICCRWERRTRSRGGITSRVRWIREQ
jgi:hypothetical protein